MPFAVVLPGGTRDSEFEQYVRLLERRGINPATSPRIEAPGNGDRWLYAWQDQVEAEGFADELKAITGNPDWKVYEIPRVTLEPLICPNCHVSLDERQLVTNTWTVESCPHCRAMVRTQDQFRRQDTGAMVREDVDAIQSWLDRVAREGKISVVQDMGEKGQGKYRWEIVGLRVSGSPLPWSCTVEYLADAPRVFEVRLTSREGGEAIPEDRQPLANVCAEHGVQPHATKTRSWKPWEGNRVEVRWGTRQWLGTEPLPEGLFAAVIARLDHAMRDAVGRLKLKRNS